MLTIKNLSFSYSKNRKRVLTDFNLEVNAGQICGLLGPNGSGKSTLLYLMSGLLTPQNGTIEFKGMTPRRRHVAFLEDVFIVPEEFNLPAVKLESYLKVNTPFYPRFSHEDLKKYLETFDLDPDLNLGQLSMGQKKKVFMSFALACNTSLLLMDEPTNGLDIPGKRAFRQAVVREMSDERSIIISTHQVHDVERILDHVTIIEPKRGVLLNTSMASITDKLSFAYSDNRDMIDEALLSIPAPGGAIVIKESGEDTPETEANLEALFELAVQRPDVISRIFNNEK